MHHGCHSSISTHSTGEEEILSIPIPLFFLCPYMIVQYLIKVQDLRHLVYLWYKPINYLTSISCRTCRPVSPAYMNFLLYRPVVPFTSMSLTSVMVSCTTHRSALPAAYTNFLLHGPMLLSCLAYNLWACGTLYVEPHICLMYNSWACIALIHVFIYLFCGLALPSVVLCTPYGPTLPLYHEHI